MLLQGYGHSSPKQVKVLSRVCNITAYLFHLFFDSVVIFHIYLSYIIAAGKHIHFHILTDHM